MFAVFGSGGVGRALAFRLLRGGSSVVMLSRDADKLAAVAGAAPNPHLLQTQVVDCLSPPSIEDACRAIAATGPLSGLVFAVGSIPLRPMKATSAKEFADAFQLNALAPFLALKALAPALAANEGGKTGSAVLFSSIAASVGFPNHSAIAAAKAAVEGLTRSAAAELAPKVRVNCIAPSLTDTPLAARFLASPTMKSALGQAHPIPRVGTADEVAALGEFLLSDDKSGWMTGQVLHVDGGRSTLRTT
jgi:NAD(P)-dependent dehydrogenase (short-subunit alcohol dehydrogenase family)